MSKNLNTTLLLLFAITFQLTAQKYLDQDKQAVTREYMGKQISSDSMLSANLKVIGGMKTYAGYVATYEEKGLGADYMGTFFVITDQGFEAEEDTAVLQQLSDTKAQTELVKALMVPGRLDAHQLRKEAAKHGGSIQLRSEQGALITVSLEGDKLQLVDNKGRKATVTAADLLHKNGFFHILGGYVNPAEQQKD